MAKAKSVKWKTSKKDAAKNPLKTVVTASKKNPGKVMAGPKFKDTSKIKVSSRIVDQVIGQDKAVEVIRKAAKQRRHVFLIGAPGTGKSMLGLALAELLPKEKLVDIVSFYNPNDDNQPLIRTVNAGEGRELMAKSRVQASTMFRNQNLLMFIFAIIAMIAPWWVRSYYKSDIMFAAFFLGGMMFLAAFVIFLNVGKKMPSKEQIPKVIVDNFNKEQAPFFDATGAHAGALLGDVLHDPFQSGGLGTPAHERVVAGMIHKANKGVLFIDEIATLQPHTQQELLSSLQEKKYSITGQSERSAGAMVRTEAVPCDFVMIAAGNLETVKHMHPALRSRISGYGYEVYMEETMKDSASNRHKIAVFIAQEIMKDQKIPAFSSEAVDVIIDEAKRRANRKGHLTLRLRDLGGLVRAAGDLAAEGKSELVSRKHVLDAMN
ncbi:MAG: ATP-dependent protease LonB, partial [Candidatus Nanoarchaeia archaeon]